MLSERGAPSIHLAPLPLKEVSLPTSPNLEAPSDTKVLLAISVARDVDFSVTKWANWLKTDQAPAEIMKIEARLESAYESNSTIVILSVPTLAWSRMVDRDAYNFIGFVRSENLLKMFKTRNLKTAKEELSESQASSLDHREVPALSQSTVVEWAEKRTSLPVRGFRDSGFEDPYHTPHSGSSRPVSTNVTQARSQDLSFIDFVTMTNLRNTADQVRDALQDNDFNDELQSIIEWFKVLSDAERLASIGKLLEELTAEQKKFTTEFLYKSGYGYEGGNSYRAFRKGVLARLLPDST